MSYRDIKFDDLEKDLTFSVITYNVCNVDADLEWNQNRWKYILDKITERDPDIIILHEMSDISCLIRDIINILHIL